jgi:murein DD-endopeptidase MepM/ murein hydrolase activator NlpD
MMMTVAPLLEAPAEPEADPNAEPPLPTEFEPSVGRGCHRSRRGRAVCDGPRRIPVSDPESRERARRLGLGSRQVGQQLLFRAPNREWVAAVDGEAPLPLSWPVADGHLWRGFGYTRDRPATRHRPHLGIDIGAPEGSIVRSIADGLVLYSDNGMTGYGNLLMIAHEDASVAFYAHNRTNYVVAGQRVRRGQVISEVGHTGLARGDHVHFELHVNGRARNPMPMFDPATIPVRGEPPPDEALLEDP